MPDDSFEPPTADEFDKLWVMPGPLVQRLSALVNGDQTAVDEIMQRLIGGQLGAVAGASTRINRGQIERPALTLIPEGWWYSATEIRKAHAAFWRTGTVVLTPPRTRAGENPQSIQLFDVRFDPAGIEAIPVIRVKQKATTAPASPNPSRAPAKAVKGAPKPKVGRDELRAWMTEFGGANPGASFRVILTNARLHFPNNHVAELPVKHMIAELKLNLTVGNPTILRKNRGIETPK